MGQDPQFSTRRPPIGSFSRSRVGRPLPRAPFCCRTLLEGRAAWPRTPLPRHSFFGNGPFPYLAPRNSPKRGLLKARIASDMLRRKARIASEGVDPIRSDPKLSGAIRAFFDFRLPAPRAHGCPAPPSSSLARPAAAKSPQKSLVKFFTIMHFLRALAPDQYQLRGENNTLDWRNATAENHPVMDCVGGVVGAGYRRRARPGPDHCRGDF